ncbi:MAG: BACON domain-containing carbohydrate-binding protein [Terriglobia bacterium]
MDFKDDNIAYLADNRGIHKTTNGGASWTDLNAYFITSHIILDPTNHTTLYLVTVSGDLIKSTDAGANWTILDTKLPCNDRLKKLVIDPTNPNILYAIILTVTTVGSAQYADYYVIKSTDGGANWTQLAWKAYTLSIDPTNSNILYAAPSIPGSSTSGLQKSADGGVTWNRIETGLPFLGPQALGTVIVDPKTPSTLYVVANMNGLVVYKSSDSGGQWQSSSAGIINVSTLTDPVIDPLNPNNLYIVGKDSNSNLGRIFKTSNGGGQWSPLDVGIATANVQVIALAPSSPASLHAGTLQHGILKSVNSGSTWVTKNTGIKVLIGHMVLDPSDKNVIYVGIPGLGVFRSSDGGYNWVARNAGLGSLSIAALAISPVGNKTLWASVDNALARNIGGGIIDHFPAIYRSTDGGVTWIVTALPANNFASSAPTRLVADPVDPNGIYALSLGLYHSTDGGTSWSYYYSGLPVDLCTDLAIDPKDPTILYLSIARSTLGTPLIYKSTDKGLTWSPSALGIPDAPFISHLAIDPITPSTIYAASVAGYPANGGVFKSVDSGGSWQDTTLNFQQLILNYSGTQYGNIHYAGSPSVCYSKWYISAYSLAIDSNTPSTLFAAVNGFVLRTTDAADTWVIAHDGLPSSPGPISISTADHTTAYAANQGIYLYTGAGDGSGTSQSLTVVSPNGGEIWMAGSSHNITWSTTGTSTDIKIEYSTDSGLTYSTIVASTPNSGSYSWEVPNTPSANIVIRISEAHGGIWDTSDRNFTIATSGSDTPTLSVLSPNGGEIWLAGSSHNITWSTTGTVGSVKIEYSTDSGLTYSTIVATTANSGSYSWIIPTTPSTTVKVRISDVGATVSDTSNANFTIITSGGGCAYTISPLSRLFGPSGGMGSLAVSSGTTCPWTATSSVPWVTISSGAHGTANGTVNYSVASNTSTTSRTGTITIAGQIAKIIQESTSGISSELFTPIVLDSTGLAGSHYTTETTFTNRGTYFAEVDLTYTSAFGGGDGTGSFILPPGQNIISDTIGFLKGLGIPIPDSGSRGGSLRAHFSNLSSASDINVTVRTSTDVKNVSGALIGRAGLAYPAISAIGCCESLHNMGAKDSHGSLLNSIALDNSTALASAALTAPAYVCGLRQNATDRSNVAFQNVGAYGDGSVTLKATVFDGDSSFSQILPPIVLTPGAFFQLTGVLASNGLSLSNGYIKVERTNGTAPYFAYGVINDQVNSDGSFVIPQPGETTLISGLTLPVIVQTSNFSSELVLTNFSPEQRTINFTFVAEAISNADKTAHFNINLPAGKQLIIPDIFAYMRSNSVEGIGADGTTIVGSLFATATGGDIGGVVLGARTYASGGSAEGRFGLFYTAVPYGQASTTSAWVFGLQQNSENRTNLALVNTGETNSGSDTFVIDLYDGNTGKLVQTMAPITLGARGWAQIGAILKNAGLQNGYVHVRRTAGNNPFITYAVINDGAGPGQRTGDGAYLGSSE